MTTRSTLISLATLATLFAARPALANDADETACAGLTEGAACVDGDGAEGTCVVDEDDPGVLGCEEVAEDACVGLAEGAACIDALGAPGACVLDAEGELECEDVDGDDDGADDDGADDDGADDDGADDDGADDDGADDDGGAPVGLGGPNGGETRSDEDKAACVDLDEGDACTRADGDAGTCIPDESDASVLTCDDDASSSSSSSGCSAAGSPASAAGGLLALGLGLIVGARRRKQPAR